MRGWCRCKRPALPPHCSSGSAAGEAAGTGRPEPCIWATRPGRSIRGGTLEDFLVVEPHMRQQVQVGACIRDVEPGGGGCWGLSCDVQGRWGVWVGVAAAWIGRGREGVDGTGKEGRWVVSGLSGM